LLSKKQIGTAIRNSTPPHGIVLDLFARCGATLIEAHASGRRVYGIEQNCFAVEHALSRICALTGIEAVKKGAGQTNALALSENFGEES
jgi:DNA modification methylase